MRSMLVALLAVGLAVVVALNAQSRATSVDRLTPAQQLAFERGRATFSKFYRIEDGRGPLFNEVSCIACHGGEAGREGTRLNTHFGRRDDEVFDPLAELGGTLAQLRGIGPVTMGDSTYDFVGEVPPRQANVTTMRRTLPLQGLGFVDAVPDATWHAIAEDELATDPSTAGRVGMVVDLASRSAAVGKFGWKAQVPTLLQFAGDALRNEIGITNPAFRDEVCPQGDCQALAFNPVQTLNDDGTDVATLADFMTMLAAPPRGTVTSIEADGERIFMQIGCARCHLPTIQTGPSPVAALDRTSFHPYSDFLLHDMGSLGDGISQGEASGREIRTAPLWGLRTGNRFLHDGRAASVTDAIMRHDGQGRAALDRFTRLARRDMDLLLAFLRSL